MNENSKLSQLIENLQSITSPSVLKIVTDVTVVSSKKDKQAYLSADHVFHGLVQKSEEFRKLLKAVGFTNETIEVLNVELGYYLKQNIPVMRGSVVQEQAVSSSFKDLFKYAHSLYSHPMKEGWPEKSKLIDEADILIASFELEDSFFSNFLMEVDVKKTDVINYLVNGTNKKPIPVAQVEKVHQDYDENLKPEVSIIEKYSYFLNKAVQEGKIDPIIGRDTEVEAVINILSQRRKANPILVGDPGVGKTAVAEGLAYKIEKNEVPDGLKDLKIYSLDLTALCSGTKYRGDYENRVKRIIEEASQDPNIVLFIDEIHMIIGAGKAEGSMDASNMLKPALSRGLIKIIGATTQEEFRRIFERDGAMSRRFQKVDVNEPTKEEAKQILHGIVGQYQEYHNVSYDSSVVDDAISLSVKYMPNKKLPDKAIDLIDALGAKVKLDGKLVATKEDLKVVVSKMTGIPISDLDDTEKEKLKNLERDISANIYGQKEAVAQVVDSVIFNKAIGSLKDKPIATFLFAGSSGVGKTELSKVLAKNLGAKLIRIDMSEYTESHSVAKLLGAPPGYVSHEAGGILTERVAQYPNSVILLDEIEKANPEIMKTLLQVFDYGSLTDSRGVNVDFKNTIIIMTSNLGASHQKQKKPIGFDSQRVSQKSISLEKIKSHFPVEFFNRIDSVIVFNNLSKDDLVMVANKYLSLLKKRVEESGVSIEFGADVVDWIIKKSSSEVYGAREIERLIELNIAKPLAKELIFNDTVGSAVFINILNDSISFERQKEIEETLVVS